MSDGHHDPATSVSAGLGKGRIEALTDGIYAVAMTLLVIELKVPDPHLIHSHAELVDAFGQLLPKAGAWLISFFVLAAFWLGHHRLFNRVRIVDHALLWRNLYQLALVALLPFSASMIGEFGSTPEAYFVYNGNMILLCLTSIWQIVHVYRHPELRTSSPFTTAQYHAALLRTGGLACAGIGALLIASVSSVPVLANYTYLLMWPLGLHVRRRTARIERAAAANATQPSHS